MPKVPACRLKRLPITDKHNFFFYFLLLPKLRLLSHICVQLVKLLRIYPTTEPKEMGSLHCSGSHRSSNKQSKGEQKHTGVSRKEMEQQEEQNVLCQVPEYMLLIRS